MSTRLDFFPGAYGPTLAIAPDDLPDLLAVQRLFSRLAAGDLRTADFQQSLHCRSTTVGALIVRVVERDVPPAIAAHGTSRLGPELWWSSTRERWQGCVDLCEALITSEEPGHQYLTREGVDGVLVELKYREAP